MLDGGVNIFQEIRKFRGQSSTHSSRIDKEVGSLNIANHFAEIYKNLYINTQLGPDFKDMHHKIINVVDEISSFNLNRINEDSFKNALNLMKAKKSDSVFNISSDFYLNGQPELTSHLTRLLRLFFSHGHIPETILICTLLPLVKDKLGDITASSNYHAIAGGCLLLKLIDLVILQLEGDK